MRIMVFVFLCGLLSSCGKAGALYLPTDDTGVTEEKQQTENN